MQSTRPSWHFNHEKAISCHRVFIQSVTLHVVDTGRFARSADCWQRRRVLPQNNSHVHQLCWRCLPHAARTRWSSSKFLSSPRAVFSLITFNILKFQDSECNVNCCYLTYFTVLLQNVYKCHHRLEESFCHLPDAPGPVRRLSVWYSQYSL